MPKFAANLSFLFTEVAFPERFAAAARAGFKGVEYLFPYDWPATEVAAWLNAAGVEQVLFNLPGGDWARGDRGMACQPGREAEFREGARLAVDYARELGCRRLHAMAGLRVPGASEAEMEACYLGNIRYAAEICAGAGITLMIEPINSRIDMPGYWLDSPRQAFALLDKLACANVRVQYDIYHAQIMEGDLARTITANLDKIGHFQLADNPGRHEPGTGEIHYPHLFALLDRLAYTGWIGCEYRPRDGTLAGLGWMPRN